MKNLCRASPSTSASNTSLVVVTTVLPRSGKPSKLKNQKLSFTARGHSNASITKRMSTRIPLIRKADSGSLLMRVYPPSSEDLTFHRMGNSSYFLQDYGKRTQSHTRSTVPSCTERVSWSVLPSWSLQTVSLHWYASSALNCSWRKTRRAGYSNRTTTWYTQWPLLQHCWSTAQKKCNPCLAWATTIMQHSLTSPGADAKCWQFPPPMDTAPS